MTDLIVTSYGRPASESLARAVAAAKRAGPLAPVTVVVPSNFAGLAARRLLAGGALGGTGLANVSFLTPFRLAELVAVGRLRGRRPLTNPVLGAAVRRTLAESPRHFGPVRDHQATEQAVAAAVGELSNVSATGLDAIVDAGGFAASVVEVHRDVVGRLQGFHAEADLARAAAHRPDLAEAMAAHGTVVWYLPGATSAPLAGFLRAALSVTESSVIVGLSGVPEADAEVRRTLRIAGLDLPATVDLPEVPLASQVVSVTDADEEVRHVVREVVGLVEDGVSLDRIGVFHPVPDPYVRILEQQFAAAGITANGPSRRRLADSVAGRVLSAALSLPSERWRRDRVMALVSTGPIRHGDGLVRPSRFETVSRDAGVVVGRGDWKVKLDAHHERLTRQRGEALEVDHTRRAEALEAVMGEVVALRSFVDDLAEGVAEVLDRAGSWQQRSQAAVALLRRLLGPPHRHGWWPEPDQVAFEQVEAALERLAALDEIEPDPSASVFLRALGAELSVARERSGRFGEGVVYGPLASAAGHDLDAVFVLGCAEGLLPAPRREDALLPDKARSLTDGDLAPRLGQLHEQHRLFMAALSAAPAGRRWLLFPRGDLRSNRRARPSRWLLPSASALVGSTLYATDFDGETPAGLTDVASHARALRDADHHASLAERDLAEVLAFVEDDEGDALDHPAAAGARAGLMLQRFRAGSELSQFDGNLGGQVLPTTDDRPLSPSRLETWAACGFRYFLSYVLDLGDREDPEHTIELSALDRGSAMHEILERFLAEVTDTGPPAPDEPWTPEQRGRARVIADEVFDDYERRGRTGRPVMWGTQKADLLASLDEFLDADDVHRRDRRAVPAWFELPFGLDGAPPVEIEIGPDRRLRFRGYIDRIDTAVTEGDPDGAPRLIVSDYKTGSGTQYRDLERNDDPTVGGTLLQLGLYAEAAHQLLGAASVDTRYWMVNPRANYQRLGYEWTADHRARLTEVVATIVDGIESGVFAAAPGDWDGFRRTYKQCAFCEFDDLCPRDRAEQADAKAAAPELAVRVALTRRPGDEDDGGEAGP